MQQRLPRARFLPLLLACAVAGPVRAQQLIGYVNTRDAETTGASDMLDGQAVLTGSVGVTARDHTAPITLGRGGLVRVCQTSALHLTESRSAAIPAPLLFSLDRGAIEIQTDSTPNDSIMTPDLRFTVHNAAPLDLRLRVARNGDTCVDNRGAGAPTLAVSDPFGEAMYEVGPGQHVLFEHGSLREVVDDETSPCGCPDEKGMSIADALLASPRVTTGPTTPNPPLPAPPAAAPVVVPAAAPVAVQPAVPVAAPAAAPATAPPAPTVARAVPPPPPAPAAVAIVPVAPPPAAAPVVHPAAPVAAAVVQPAAPVVVTVAAPAAAPIPAPAAAPPPDPAAAEQAAEQAVERAAAEAAARAAALHPFPTAVSEGLEPPAETPSPAPGPAVPAQVAAGLSYNAPPSIAASAPAAAPATAPAVAPNPKPAPAPPAHGLAHAIGHFFRKLFGG